MKQIKSLLFIFVVLGCANELTQEQRNREEAMRSYNRLVKAQGKFQGFMEVGAGTTPIELTVTVLGNPTEGDKHPQIQSTIRIGLFGGVLLPSRGAAFDWGTGELTLSFGRTATDEGNGATSSLELSGIVGETGIQNARMVGAKQGAHDVTLEKVERFDAPPSDETYYRVWDTRQEWAQRPQALLSIKKKPSDTVSPDGSDMPMLPGLDVAMRFEHLGQTPQNAIEALYDPLAGTLILYFTPESRLDITGVVTETGLKAGAIPNTLSGTIFMNGLEQYYLRFDAEPSTKPIVKLLPPVGYRGTFSTGPDSPPFRAVAYLKATGAKLNNGLEFPFKVFPEFRITLFVCDKDKSIAIKELRAITLHPLDRVATFTGSETGFKNDLELNYSEDWSELKGAFVSHKSGEGSEPQFTLVSDPKLGVDGCKE